MFRTIPLLLIAFVTTAAGAGELKSTRIALFNSGVGYFESASSVEGDSTAELTFRVEQINDILKSLILRDLDGGTISAVQYPSRDPIEKTLRSFGVDVTGKPTLGQLLDQLRGVLVEVQSVSPVTGTVFGVERRKEQTEHGGTIERDVLTILTSDGLKSFDLTGVAGVKIKDAKVEGELTKALAALALAHDADKKSVTLNFSGQGKRRVMVSYILETPIWKTSYRLGLSKDKKPFLQGWALVDNATEQDWENVQLSLVSGRPISFTMDLYQPLYIPRPVQQLALYGSIRPPEYEANFIPADVARPAAAPAALSMKRAHKASGGQEQSMASRGRFAGKDADGVSDDEEEIDKSNILRPQSTGVESVASAQSAGELFEYAIKTPVTLKRQQSAMLPIVTVEVEGQKLSVWNQATHPKHPLNAVKLKNSSPLFLMQGPVTVFNDGVYAGDAMLPDLRANEDRLVGYALDLATEVDVKYTGKPDEITQLRIAKGTLILRRKFVNERTYTVRNKADAAKSVILEHPTSPEWTLVEPKEPFEKTANMLRFKVDVPAGETKALSVVMESIREEQVVLSNMGGEQIEVYLRMRVVSDAVKKALSKVVELRSALDDTQRKIAAIQEEINAIATEQTRIRENMKVLAQNSDVYRRYEKKFGEQENRVEKLRADLSRLNDTLRGQQHDLEQFLLSIDVS